MIKFTEYTENCLGLLFLISNNKENPHIIYNGFLSKSLVNLNYKDLYDDVYVQQQDSISDNDYIIV